MLTATDGQAWLLGMDAVGTARAGAARKAIVATAPSRAMSIEEDQLRTTAVDSGPADVAAKRCAFDESMSDPFGTIS